MNTVDQGPPPVCLRFSASWAGARTRALAQDWGEAERKRFLASLLAEGKVKLAKLPPFRACSMVTKEMY